LPNVLLLLLTHPAELARTAPLVLRVSLRLVRLIQSAATAALHEPQPLLPLPRPLPRPLPAPAGHHVERMQLWQHALLLQLLLLLL
jgi:hypothetical protein